MSVALPGVRFRSTVPGRGLVWPAWAPRRRLHPDQAQLRPRTARPSSGRGLVPCGKGSSPRRRPLRPTGAVCSPLLPTLRHLAPLRRMLAHDWSGRQGPFLVAAREFATAALRVHQMTAGPAIRRVPAWYGRLLVARASSALRSRSVGGGDGRPEDDAVPHGDHVAALRDRCRNALSSSAVPNRNLPLMASVPHGRWPAAPLHVPARGGSRERPRARPTGLWGDLPVSGSRSALPWGTSRAGQSATPAPQPGSSAPTRPSS